MKVMSEKDFKFHIPVDLVKGDDDEWRIEGVASTEDEDLQGETVDQNGLDISMLKAGRGLFNYDHQKGPENIIGEIEDADFVNRDGKKCLMVKGYLFKHQDRSKAFFNILKSLKKGSAQRVQMSIEGKILQRDFVNNKAIKKARVDKVALTFDPVNPYTYAQLVKSLNSPEPIQEEVIQPIEIKDETITIRKSDLEKILDFAQKALSAGVGYASAPASRTGGAAMTKESLESKVSNVGEKDKKKKDKKDMLKSLMKSLKEAYPEKDPMELAEWVLNTFVDKLESK
jgi:hypothetical protein